jgi:DNA invertase Pin-like site-specific DNA recombinase
MSTEHQHYSFGHQAAAIKEYADRYGFAVVKTYSDAALSGLVLKRRKGLQSLLQDVVTGDAQYSAILVYDVSRWGRFQNTDESAHYEFICTSAGVPIHYCVEQFRNDTAMPNMIMKALKRTMAGEYSRELGVRVYDSQKRHVHFGHKMGGIPGYGLRRMLVGRDGRKKLVLKKDEQKNIKSDHVILVRGPADEVRWVQRIFRMALKRSTIEIVHYLNTHGVKYTDGGLWTLNRIIGILKNPKYTGQYIWGRVSVRLYTPKKTNPPNEWHYGPKTFRPIISREMYEKVQQARMARYARIHSLSNEMILERVRAIVQKHGRVTGPTLKLLGVSTTLIYTRFKGLMNVYRMLGIKVPDHKYSRIGAFYKNREIRLATMNEILKLFPGEIQMFKLGASFKPLLIYDKTVTLAVATGINVRKRGDQYWKFHMKFHDSGSVCLACLLDRTNRKVEHYYLVRRMKFLGERVRLNSRVLSRSIYLGTLAELTSAIRLMMRTKHPTPYA